jgi:hypothetical protein
VGDTQRGCLSVMLLGYLGSQLGCIGSVIALLVLGVAAYYAVKVLVEVVRVLLVTGALFGLAITVRNYGQALYHNIKRERLAS